MKLLTTFLLTLLFAFPVFAQEIKVVYSQRAPLIMKTETGITGSVGQASSDAFIKAGFKPVFVELPLARQLIALEENAEPVCALNYFKRAEREKIGKFSEPVLTDNPIGVLLSKTNEKVKAHKTFADLTKDENLRFARKVELSYGNYLDNLLKTNNTKIVESTEENTARVKQILLGRADYMFIQESEFKYIVETEKLNLSDFSHIQMTDAPEPNKRYIICSFKVDEIMMEKLNKAIK
jgi:polar amino acid transport system substrate-binding protein